MFKYLVVLFVLLDISSTFQIIESKSSPQIVTQTENGTLDLFCGVDSRIGRCTWVHKGAENVHQICMIENVKGKLATTKCKIQGNSRLSVVNPADQRTCYIRISPSNATDLGSWTCHLKEKKVLNLGSSTTKRSLEVVLPQVDETADISDSTHFGLRSSVSIEAKKSEGASSTVLNQEDSASNENMSPGVVTGIAVTASFLGIIAIAAMAMYLRKKSAVNLRDKSPQRLVESGDGTGFGNSSRDTVYAYWASKEKALKKLGVDNVADMVYLGEKRLA